MNPNCERISRKGERIQWDGSNTDDVMGLLARGGLIGELYRDNQYILIRSDGTVDTSIKHGTWVLMGEDRKIRFYSDDDMKLMYIPIVKNDEMEQLRGNRNEQF